MISLPAARQSRELGRAVSTSSMCLSRHDGIATNGLTANRAGCSCRPDQEGSQCGNGRFEEGWGQGSFREPWQRSDVRAPPFQLQSPAPPATSGPFVGVSDAALKADVLLFSGSITSGRQSPWALLRFSGNGWVPLPRPGPQGDAGGRSLTSCNLYCLPT